MTVCTIRVVFCLNVASEKGPLSVLYQYRIMAVIQEATITILSPCDVMKDAVFNFQQPKKRKQKTKNPSINIKIPEKVKEYPE